MENKKVLGFVPNSFILFLDDSPERFNELSGIRDSIQWVQTVEAFLYFARKFSYKKIMMDHDLNTYQKDPEDFFIIKEVNGTTACEELAKDPGMSVGTPIIIHSHNSVGAERMYKILKNSGHYENVTIDPF